MATVPPILSTEPEPVWALATLYPAQGGWSEEEYLSLTDSTNRLIEFTDGRVEFLAMPTEAHQFILLFLMDCLRAFVEPIDRGKVLFCGLRVRIRPSKIREPDIVYIAKENYARRGNRFWSGADLVMEVVSDDEESRERDHETKVVDYAEAKIPEYWIVDPEKQQITVLALNNSTGQYAPHGTFVPGQTATSRQLSGFGVDVTAVFAAANG